MKQHIAHITLVVDDYDEAIGFYVGKLDFELVADNLLSDNKRWVLVKPKGADGCSRLLAKAVGTEQKSRLGNQTGGRVFLFLCTDDFWGDYYGLLAKGIRFIRTPVKETYGTVAVFEDLYRTRWDLLEPAG